MNAKEELTKLLMESYDRGVKDIIQAGFATASKMVAEEREACAKVADGWPDYDVQGLAEAIRARGEQE